MTGWPAATAADHGHLWATLLPLTIALAMRLAVTAALQLADGLY